VVIDTEFVTSFDVLPDGRLVVCSMLTKPESEYMVRIHPLGWPAKPASRAPEVIPGPLSGETCEVYAIKNLIVGFDRLIAREDPPEAKQPYVLKGRRFRPATDLPEVRTFDSSQFAHQTYANGKVTLADGTDVLIWDGHGYEVKRGRFERTWDLAAEESAVLGGWTAVPWGGDGFFYLSDRRVSYARRGVPPVPVMPDADNVMFLSPGPEDSVIASHGRNRKALAARVWFPASGVYIPVTRKELGIASHFSPAELYWSGGTGYVYTKHGDLLTFPASDLLALKRVRPRAGGYKV
jgi:hypothetical protein